MAEILHHMGYQNLVLYMMGTLDPSTTSPEFGQYQKNQISKMEESSPI